MGKLLIIMLNDCNPFNFGVWKLFIPIGCLFLLGCMLSLKQTVANSIDNVHRERISINEDWRFYKYESIAKTDDLVYDVRPEVKDTDKVVVADEMPMEAVKAEAKQAVLKPWILPTGNNFIEDPAKRHVRPEGSPGSNFPFVQSDFNDSSWERVNLPHDWAIECPFYEGWDVEVGGGMGRLPSPGVAWYRKKIDIPKSDAGKSIFLDVDGAMSYAMVWLDGKLVGGWPYGYASWRVNLTPYVVPGGENQLAIRLDNPPKSSRWYPGGGIYRNVWLTKTNPVHIGQWGTFVKTRDVSKKSAKVDMQVNIDNDSKDDATVKVITQIYTLNSEGNKTGSAVETFKPLKTTVAAGKSVKVKGSVTLKNPKLWGPPPTQVPNRYVAVTTLWQNDKPVDQYETCFGIRFLKFDTDKGIFVNGEHIKIKGVNQHHDLGALGAAFNNRAAERQLGILCEMGCNAIRTAHSPPAPELLELADKMGFLVMDEIFDVWEMKKTPLDFHLIFPDWHEQDLRAFIRRDRNHPSVIIWSFGNEVGEQYTGEEGAVVAKRLHKIVKEEDSTRPTTTAMNWSKPDMPLPEVPDVISLNYQGEGIRQDPMFEGTDRISTPPQYPAFREKFPDKVILSSETASAFSSRGIYLFPVVQKISDIVRDGRGGDSKICHVSAYELHAVDFGSSADKVFRSVEQHPFVAGEFVWTGWDYIGEPTPYYSSRSSYCGIIDLAGFKKDRFYLYQSHWRPELPMAHILPHWNWPERVGEITPVHVFTSGDEAELFLNGKSLGRKRKGQYEYRLRWDDVKYEPGELKVVAYKNGKEWASDIMRTAGKASKIVFQPDRTTINADGLDLSFVTVTVQDSNGVIVPRADNLIRFSVSGPAEIVATDNGDSTDFKVFSSGDRNAFNGLAMVIVRAKPGQPGTIELKAESDSLQSATMTLQSAGEKANTVVAQHMDKEKVSKLKPGENPIIRDIFTADPAPLVYRGTVYLYVGHDEAKGNEMFNMKEWLCYSSKNMKNWTMHGPIMKVTDFKWAVRDAWAAQTVEKNGKFYFYATVQHDDTHPGKAIGVAVSDSPTGPFVDARGSALVTDETTPGPNAWDDIDPTVFIDDDGMAWMVWGNPNCYLAKLKPNMVEIDGSIQKIDLPNYTEGPWLYKRGDMYYLVYAAFAHQGQWEKICYATAPNITGPWTYQGIITGSAKNSYTIHPGIIKFKGQWYFFYHNAVLTLPNGETGGLGRRSVCVEYLYYNPDGTIKPIEQTNEGVSVPPQTFTHIEAQTYQKTALGIKLIINSIEVEIQFYNPSTVRVLKSPEGKTFDKKSLSVIETPQKTDFSIKQVGDELSLKSKSVHVILNLKNGKISFSSLTGEPLLSEKEAGVAFTDFNDAGVKTYSVYQSFVLDEDEAIYGLGQQQQGKMVQRNLKLHMVQGNTDDYAPFFQSVKGYGLFWDNYSPTLFEDNPESTSFKSDVGDCVDYYFMYGGNADGVIADMRGLTGQAPMFPLWTYGYWQSKERYKSQDETVGVVKKYRELGLPLDGIIQDWQYWGNNYLWNAMEFLNPEFYNPQKMIDDVHKLNAHMIISIWSSFGPQTKPYKALDKIGALFNIKTWPESGSEKWPPNPDYPSGVRVYDPYNPDARDIYWKYLNKGIFSLGMDGWWMDSTEPDHFDFKPSDFDTKTYLGSWRRVRNAFPLMTVGGVYQHQRSVTSEKRVFILTRSAFAGQQRYGANTWSGDVVASWGALRNQISAGLNFSLCGIPYWNSDIGGFFLWNFKNKLEDAEYRELYARWIQFGAFCPMMRSHGTDAPREIYQFGKKGDKIYDAIEKFIILRYYLLPYIYSTSWDVTANQSTMMRALVMDFAKDKKALDINNEFMFGKSILVCPVTNSMYSKNTEEDFSTIKTRELYLPKGADWYDFWTGERHTGGQTLNKETPIDIIPLYVKAGSIIPFGPRVQYATEKDWSNIEIRIYPGADGQFILYEDENDNYNYEKGIYSTIIFSWNDAKKVLTINDREGSFPGMLKEREFTIVLVNAGKGTGMGAIKKYDKVVTYYGKKVLVKL